MLYNFTELAECRAYSSSDVLSVKQCAFYIGLEYRLKNDSFLYERKQFRGGVDCQGTNKGCFMWRGL